MSTLTGNKISLTYKSLIKTADNDVLTAVLKELSDGLGNNSGVFLNTGGDLKSTGILEFANFKGTSTSVTINKLVNEADGISNNDNDTSLATSAAVKDYVDTHVTTQDLDFSDGTNPGAVDLDSQVFAIVGTSNEIETSASGQQLQIGLPNDVTISGTFFATEFQGALAGTINSGTTATTQTAGDNSTKVATTAYVDTLDAASDLDFSADSGTGAVNLNTQVFAVTGTATQIETRVSGQGIILNLDASGVLLPNGSEATTQSAGDNSTKVATTAYVDVLDAASDLDIAGDTGTGDVNLNTQTFTLSGTTNQVITSVSGQEATFSLPSTVHRNLQGNVTGDLTGNADTATAWETARDLILSSEATGTISNVDGTQNVTGAVTLLNSAVTGKVLTGLPTPAAGNIQSSDTILEAFGKLQSQVSSISNGLIFKGSWDAATNTPTLTSGGGEVDSGTTTGQTAFKLIETGQNFNTTVTIGDKVINQVDGTTALVTVIDSNTQLTLDADIMLSGEAYTIDASPFIPQGNYYVVNYAGTTNLNGITDWSIGDWVIADADNRWSKLDHSQVDGQGTPGHLPVFATATTIGDSIVAQSGTALTVTGSLSTTLGASVTGDFAVNTDKFTVAAASGNTAFAGDLAINTDKFTVNATSGNISVGGTGTFAGDVTTGQSLLVNGVGNNSSLTLGANTGNWVFTNVQASRNLEISDSDGTGTVMTIDTSGNVGIGDDNPSNLLTLYKNASQGNPSSHTPANATLKIEDSANTMYLDGNSIVATGSAAFTMGNTAAADFILYTNATERMRIDSSGTTTITNGANDNTLLLLNGARGRRLRVEEHNTGNGGIAITSQDDNETGTTNSNNRTILLNASGGNVGIGTNSPDNPLEVVGVISSADSGLQKSTFANVGNDLVLTANADATNVTANILFKSSGSGGAAVSEKMRIDSSGNVGIGTGADIYGDLHLEGGQQDIVLTNTNADGVAGLTISRIIGQARGYGNNGAVMQSIDFETNPTNWFKGDIVFKTNNSDGTNPSIAATERMRIDSSGNVGIGTDSPSKKLVVAQSNVTEPTGVDANTSILIKNNTWSGMTLLSTSSTGSFITFGDENAGFAGRIQYTHSNDNMVFETGAVERLRIAPDGGSSFAIIKAQQGTYNSIAALSLYGTNPNANGGSVVSRSSILSQTDGTAFGANLIFKVNDTSNVEQERMRIDSSGNVSIGDGGAGARGARLFLNNTGSQGTPQLMLVDSNDSGKQSEIRFDSGNLIFDYWGGTSRSERMRISSSGLATFKNNIELDSTTPTLSLEGRNSGNSGAVIQFLGWNGEYLKIGG